MSFFDELKRRNVFRVGFAYAVVAWVIAQVADLALESFGTPEWVMKTLLFMMAIGFVVSLVIAWAYELTPDGIKRARDVDPVESITHETGRKLDRLFIVVLLIALATLLVERYYFRGSAAVEEAEPVAASLPQAAGGESPRDGPSVAVLPFVNMSSDPEQGYFSDGISEEILNVLTRIPGLKVAARTSSFQFKGQNLDIAEIGRQLQVNHLLEGSVRKSGSTLRITAQLIEANTGFHLWSETFDRELEDVFAIQDEIAAAIAGELQARLSDAPLPASTPVDMEAYELYLKGRGLVASRGQKDLFDGIEVLKDAIRIEPDYAPALATLAKAYAVLPFFSRQIAAGEAREFAREWSTRALAIDPDNTEALSVLAIVYNESDLDPAGARSLLEKAVRSNPCNVAANNFLGDICLRTADFECAMAYESRAAELDPLGKVQLTDLANVHLLLGDYGKVRELVERVLLLDPGFAHAHLHLVYASYLLGEGAELKQTIESASNIEHFPQNEIDIYQVILGLLEGDPETARETLLRRARMAKSGNLAAVDVALEAVMAGDFDLAGELLLQAYREKDGTWMYPLWVRLPEQAPDSKPWQEFWAQPGVADLAALRRSYGFEPHAPGPQRGISQ
jgi:TolB-like protein